MRKTDVDVLLRESPGCFGFGPAIVGPEDSWCFYRKAGLHIYYQRGRIVYIEGRNAWRTQRM